MSIIFIYSFSIIATFFFNDAATTQIYTLSLHDALPISHSRFRRPGSTSIRYDGLIRGGGPTMWRWTVFVTAVLLMARSEEHTSELQSPVHLVCRLLLEKKN